MAIAIIVIILFAVYLAGPLLVGCLLLLLQLLPVYIQYWNLAIPATIGAFLLPWYVGIPALTIILSQGNKAVSQEFRNP
jgi:hypothetical protein